MWGWIGAPVSGGVMSTDTFVDSRAQAFYDRLYMRAMSAFQISSTLRNILVVPVYLNETAHERQNYVTRQRRVPNFWNISETY